MTDPTPPELPPSYWVAPLLLLALIVGICAGCLGWLSGQEAPAAVLTGGAGFAATVSLGLGLLKALRGR